MDKGQERRREDEEKIGLQRRERRCEQLTLSCDCCHPCCSCCCSGNSAVNGSLDCFDFLLMIQSCMWVCVCVFCLFCYTLLLVMQPKSSRRREKEKNGSPLCLVSNGVYWSIRWSIHSCTRPANGLQFASFFHLKGKRYSYSNSYSYIWTLFCLSWRNEEKTRRRKDSYKWHVVENSFEMILSLSLSRSLQVSLSHVTRSGMRMQWSCLWAEANKWLELHQHSEWEGEGEGERKTLNKQWPVDSFII